jgi:arginase
MRTIGLLGVPTNSAGKIDGVVHGPVVLREVGLVDALHRHAKVHDYGDVTLPDPSPTRDSRSHVIDPGGLDALVARVRDAVAPILDHGHLPLVIGGDCPLVLGCLAASSGRERVGLLFVDGHEDAYLPVQSSTGEAADMELAFALGMADASWSRELSTLLPLVAPADVRILGARDADLLRAEGVASLRDRVALVDGERLAADPARIAAAACASVPRPGGSISTSTCCRRRRFLRSITRSRGASAGTSSWLSPPRPYAPTLVAGMSPSTTPNSIPHGSTRDGSSDSWDP